MIAGRSNEVRVVGAGAMDVFFKNRLQKEMRKKLF